MVWYAIRGDKDGSEVIEGERVDTAKYGRGRKGLDMGGKSVWGYKGRGGPVLDGDGGDGGAGG